MNATSIAMAFITFVANGFSTRSPLCKKSKSFKTAELPFAFSFALALRPFVLPFKSNRLEISCIVANQ